MQIRGYDVENLKIVGFWDKNLFSHQEENGYILKDPKGKKHKVSFAEILKEKEKEENENIRNEYTRTNGNYQ